jgi:multimeric flavodoxin WrbA
MASVADLRHLLVVFHSRSGPTAELLAEVLAGIQEADEAGEAGEGVALRVLAAPDAGADDVQWADALILATPANFGYMSGLVKDFFERTYHQCLDTTAGMPYAVVVKGDTDVDGALASIRRITSGLRWKEPVAAVAVVGAITETDRAKTRELGAAVAAGLALGLY